MGALTNTIYMYLYIVTLRNNINHHYTWGEGVQEGAFNLS